MGSSKPDLPPLQRDLIHTWFSLSTEFFVTGGSALVGWYGITRTTDDVDLFTASRDAFNEAPALVRQVCDNLEASSESVRTSTSFHRYRIRRGREETVLDLVHDPAPQLHEEKVVMPDGARVDALDEILVNKICALVGRSEPRDFYDVYFLAQTGLDTAAALKQCAVKDGGVTAESLAWVLSSMQWTSFRIAGQDETTTSRVRSFFEAWAHALALELFPKPPGDSGTAS